MRGLVMTAHGGPEVLEIRDDLPDPVMGPHDLLVEVCASGLNPVDTKIRRGYLGDREPPYVLGFDVSGVVRAVGPEAQGFAVDEEVFASPSLARWGANAELVAVDSRLAAHKPKTLDHARAAALPLVTLTAWEALFDRANMQKGDWVLIHAGAGGVGHVALQLAKEHGCRVITTASREESIRLCEDLAADVVVNYRDEDFVERVMAETQGAGCPVVFDTVGGAVFERTLDCVAVNGQVVTIVHNESSAVFEKLFRKNASLHFEFMGVPALHGVGMEGQQEILRRAAELVDAGRLTPHVERTIGLDEVAAAHGDLEAGHVTGKIVIDLMA